MNPKADVWQAHSTQWDLVGPPIRPGFQDHEYIERGIHIWTSAYGSPRALVLGVTPEMVSLNWPGNTVLLAVDCSRMMIDSVWPGYPEPGKGALCANWLDLPLADSSCDIAVSDGPFSVLRYPEEYSALLRNLHRVLSPDGIFAFRIFIRPEIPENADAVYRAALDGGIGNFHAFKVRLLMSLLADTETGVRVSDVWESWIKDGPSPEHLSSRCGWPVDQINTIEAYRGQETIYTSPALSEFRKLLIIEGFQELKYLQPNYELGERCPTFILRRNSQ